MNSKSLITAALLAAGLVSVASASNVINGTNIVYITGSTAFRGNVYNCFTNNTGAGVFDSGTEVAPIPAGTSGSSGQIVYIGDIKGQHYRVTTSWTGSEVGIGAVEGLTFLKNPGIPNGVDNNNNVSFPGIPTTFLDPFTGTPQASPNTHPDLTFADTSQAASLTKTPALTEYGCVGVVTFTWAKGKNSTADAAWSRLVNVTQAQLSYQLASPQQANFITGNPADASTLVFTVGRNAGSGTHQNTLLDAAFYGDTTPVDQWAFNSTYVNDVLTYGSGHPAITSQGDLTEVVNDGFDSGSGVANVLECDTAGSSAITLGYLGMGDAANAQAGGAVYVNLDGVAENDGNINNGTYSFWGHEHLYGAIGQTTSQPGGIVATNLAMRAISSAGKLGNGSTPTANNSGLTTGSMLADKPNGGDSGYPSLLLGQPFE